MAARPPRRNDTGLVRPYRPKPADFRDRYIEMGWDGIDEHYRCNWRCIRRWIMEEGREQLRAARAAAVAAAHRDRGMPGPMPSALLGKTEIEPPHRREQSDDVELPDP